MATTKRTSTKTRGTNARKPAATPKRTAAAKATKRTPARAKAAAFAPGSDLPFIGNPALRALGFLRVTRVSQLARYTEQDLLALHGFGPKAIQILKATGVRFRK